MRPGETHYFVLPAEADPKRQAEVAALPPAVRRRFEAGLYAECPQPDGTTGYVPRDLWLQAACWTGGLEATGRSPTPGPAALTAARLVRQALADALSGAEDINRFFSAFLAMGEPRVARSMLGSMLRTEIECDTPAARAAVLALAALTFLDDDASASTPSDRSVSAMVALGAPRQHLEELAATGRDWAPGLRQVVVDVRDRLLDEVALVRAIREAERPTGSSEAPETAESAESPASGGALPEPSKASRNARCSMDMASLPDVLTVEDAMGVLGVGKSTIYDWAKSGKIPSIGYGRALRFEKKALLAWRATQARGGDGGNHPVEFNRKQPRRRN